MTVFDPKKNFALSTISNAPTPALSGTVLQVAVAEGALFPPAGAGVAFNAVVFPSNSAPTFANAEIVRVTTRVSDTFTIVRAQEGGAARAIQVGDRIIVSPTVKTFTDIENAINLAGGAIALSAAPVLMPGLAGQVRAGRVLNAGDFTALLGVSQPVGLFNLSDLTDGGSSGSPLVNKGSVVFGPGILGAPVEAAIFSGNTGQALYISDIGASDPFRIPYGSWGCWFKTGRNGVAQAIISKANSSVWSYTLLLQSTNVAQVSVSTVSGAAFQGSATGTANIADGRWHHVVGTYDGTLISLYVDGVLEAQGVPSTTGPMITSPGPFNLGGSQADGSTAAILPNFGAQDEAFVTPDVLSPEQVRILYAAKVPHTLGVVPINAKLSVRRLKRGAPLVTGDFTAVPLHLYDFTAGALADAGSLANVLTNNGGTAAAPAPDGLAGNAFNFVAGALQYLSCSDAGLPAGTTARTIGCWFKTNAAAQGTLLAYGTVAGNHLLNLFVTAGGVLSSGDGAAFLSSPGFVADGAWHLATFVYDPAAVDSMLRKLYIDGSLVNMSGAALASTTLVGANGFRVGRDADSATNYFTGQISRVFATNYAATSEEIQKLYAKGSQGLGASPKNAGDHVEAADALNVYVIADTLASQYQLDLEVTG